jgi:hypothetical protein
MSVFVVKLNNLVQGRLDLDPTSDPLAAGTTQIYGDVGTPFTASKQRQIYVAGPRRAYRLLKDGETFTDCNYWKQFAEYDATSNPAGCTAERAFISVQTDDGTVWSDVEDENTYGVGNSGTTTDDAAYGTTTATGLVNFMTTYGQPARFLQVSNTNSGAVSLVGEINGDTNVTFTLTKGSTQVFNVGDLAITKLRLKSASAATCDFSWLASIRTIPTS